MSGRLVILAAGASSRMRKSLVTRGRTETTGRMTKSMIRVGKQEKPFLDYLLMNAVEAGYTDLVLVTAEWDSSLREHCGDCFNGLRISYAIQAVPEGRSKPIGTADALLQALRAKPDWAGKSFTVCNSDNLYSIKVLRMMRVSPCMNVMPCYDRAALKYSEDRTGRFAVLELDDSSSVTGIIEKPSANLISRSAAADGRIFVSMNIFRLYYDLIIPCLETVPLHSRRNEKELPTAVSMMIHDNPGCMHGYPVSEHVPDLTGAADIGAVNEFMERASGEPEHHESMM